MEENIDPELLSRLNISVPRYTSYPTAPQFYPMDETVYRKQIALFDSTEKPLSIYIHIPFCKTMCLFCGCSVVLNRRPEVQSAYLQLLLKEISLLPFSKKREVLQLHLGGGTPTSLTEEEFDILMRALHSRFFFPPHAEISIEIDPRTVYADEGKKLKKLRLLGFNRVSFGVQDLDPIVQEAVKRRQTEEMTVETFYRAKEEGFLGINLDLIYGLPHQTVDRFVKTAEKIVDLKPDRISFFSYAKIPWLKAHQKAIPDSLLPTEREKFAIYIEARKRFIQGGYEAIGMDHFSLLSDPLTLAYREKKLMRNFQGYSISLAEDMIGLGMSSIGFLQGAYFQNKKTILEYGDCIARGELPIDRGYILQEKDFLSHWTIQKMMCHFFIDKQEFLRAFHIPFDVYFRKQRESLAPLILDGLVEETEMYLQATPLGRLFVRVIAAVFDAYLKPGMYSRAI